MCGHRTIAALYDSEIAATLPAAWRSGLCPVYLAVRKFFAAVKLALAPTWNRSNTGA